MELIDKAKLLKIILEENPKLVIVTEDDFTTRKYWKEELNDIESLGVFGFAIYKTRIYSWLKKGDKYKVSEWNEPKWKQVRSQYLHHEVGDPTKKLKEILED